MLTIHDARLPEPIIQTLRLSGRCIVFFTTNITYQAIAGHPDIFFCQTGNSLIVAPNTPVEYLKILKKNAIPIIKGNTAVGETLAQATAYNAVITDKYIIHNRKYTDAAILAHQKNKEFIHVEQAFCRCSLLSLKNDHFLTSDAGIAKTLTKHGLFCLCVSSFDIILPPYMHGCIGGCMGIYDNKVFITGSLTHHRDGNLIKNLLTSLSYEIIELYDGKLYDGGGLFFLT